MMKSLFILAFLLCISKAYGLKCYQCATTKSWDDCASIKKEQTCPSGFDRCGKVYAEGSGSGQKAEIFAKGCSTKDDCENAEKSDLCKNSDPTVKVKCEIYCCTGDLCNGATVPMVSVFMLLPCALAVLFR